MKVAIVGAGLAGCAAAYVLKRYGVEAEIYEAGNEIAPGASGNVLGLYNPRLSAERNFYVDAFEVALKTFPILGNIGWNACGALHLVTDEVRAKRFEKAVLHFQDAKLLNAAEASQVAGVDLKYGALWLPRSGVVNPRQLCATYAQDVAIHFNAKLDHLPEPDVVILANGYGVKDFIDLPLGQVRGQITQVKASVLSQKLKTNLCYGGYVSPAQDGVHMVGATFQRWLNHSDIIPQDDADNLEKLAAVMPIEGMIVAGHRAAMRTTTRDHLPIVGHVRDNIYVSTGHGSHGILSSLAGAHVLAALITGTKPPFDAEALQPQRFLV